MEETDEEMVTKTGKNLRKARKQVSSSCESKQGLPMRAMQTAHQHGKVDDYQV